MIIFTELIMLVLTFCWLVLVEWNLVSCCKVGHMVVARFSIVRVYLHLYLLGLVLIVSVVCCLWILMVGHICWFVSICLLVVRVLLADYLNTLGELQGFIASHHYDVLLIVGDFNVDYDRACSFHSVLVNFRSELDLVASDLTYRSSVGFTYEGPQGSSTSWIDHVLCSSSHSAQIIDVFSLRSGTIMSDHLPLCFSLAVKFSHAHSSSSTPRIT